MLRRSIAPWQGLPHDGRNLGLDFLLRLRAVPIFAENPPRFQRDGPFRSTYGHARRRPHRARRDHPVGLQRPAGGHFHHCRQRPFGAPRRCPVAAPLPRRAAARRLAWLHLRAAAVCRGPGEPAGGRPRARSDWSAPACWSASARGWPMAAPPATASAACRACRCAPSSPSAPSWQVPRSPSSS